MSALDKAYAERSQMIEGINGNTKILIACQESPLDIILKNKKLRYILFFTREGG